MDTVDIQAVESKLSDVTVTAIPMGRSPHPLQNYNLHRDLHSHNNTHSSTISPSTSVGLGSPQTASSTGLSKYAQLLNAIEEMGKEVRPTYAGSRTSAEKLKRSIISARLLVRECLVETERSARQ
ncbi:cyclin-dependent kinase 2-associated protein 1 isoform X1 [Dendroctonus ponderosae]|uniref:Cyclin-dependent kinase 2-associated protein n=1 Tax=Dendroctonus ponderosae TaxID=77166 RepID=A0AAR5PH11_DENPD|nr:cyclin-dependent kinase 2-associated protein 1 isoform X1 [Dendroctonus ponderosae]